MEELSTKPIRLAAMDFLARREHSCLELQQKLSRRFPGAAKSIKIEVDRLRDEGLQSDTRLAESFVRSRISRGQGPSKIRLELKAKGLADEEISVALAEAEVDWFTLASEVAFKKFGFIERQKVDLPLKSRVSRFLQQRGFSYDHIAAVYIFP